LSGCGGGIDGVVGWDDLALGEELPGAGAGDVADLGGAIVQCDFGAWNGGFSGDSALAAGGGDALWAVGSVCVLRDEVQQEVAGVWDGCDLAGIWGKVCERAALVFRFYYCGDGVLVWKIVVEEKTARDGRQMQGVWL
jgi:hypothetical protein